MRADANATITSSLEELLKAHGVDPEAKTPTDLLRVTAPSPTPASSSSSAPRSSVSTPTASTPSSHHPDLAHVATATTLVGTQLHLQLAAVLLRQTRALEADIERRAAIPHVHLALLKAVADVSEEGLKAALDRASELHLVDESVECVVGCVLCACRSYCCVSTIPRLFAACVSCVLVVVASQSKASGECCSDHTRHTT